MGRNEKKQRRKKSSEAKNCLDTPPARLPLSWVKRELHVVMSQRHGPGPLSLNIVLLGMAKANTGSQVRSCGI